MNQGTLTEDALALSRRIVKDIDALMVEMFEEGQNVERWGRFIDLTSELDTIWAELDLTCWAIGQVSPWAVQERNGEPTLAQLAAPITIGPEPEKGWVWPALKSALDFLGQQNILSSQEWNAAVKSADMATREQPIVIKLKSQVEEFRKHLREATIDGDSVRQFRKRIQGTIESTAAAVERNFRTSSKRAYLDGVQKITNTKRFQYVKYVATKDLRTRPDHLAMDGKIIRVGTPEYDYAMKLQRSYNCRCGMIPITEKQAIRQGLVLDEPASS